MLSYEFTVRATHVVALTFVPAASAAGALPLSPTVAFAIALAFALPSSDPDTFSLPLAVGLAWSVFVCNVARGFVSAMSLLLLE